MAFKFYENEVVHLNSLFMEPNTSRRSRVKPDMLTVIEVYQSQLPAVFGPSGVPIKFKFNGNFVQW